MNRRSQSGFSFIEVLIAFLVLATGLVGAVAMQAVAKKSSFDAQQRSIAISLASDILNRIKANPSQLANYIASDNADGDTHGLPSTRCNGSSGNCSAAQLLANDLYEWEQSLVGADTKKSSKNIGGLASPIGCILDPSTSTNDIAIVISWTGRNELSDAGSANSTGDNSISDASSCGADSDKSRRQVAIRTVIF